jgi:hypothetical protein
MQASLGRFYFSFFAVEAVAGAVSVPVAVQNKIVLIGRLRPSTLRRTMPASSFGVLPRLVQLT